MANTIKSRRSAKNLVIVESPTKARTISRFLDKNFIVESSYGHIRDLPKSKLGVDIENNFEPHYVIPRRAGPIIKKLKQSAQKAKRIILATDEDREGEAIAWHLIEALKGNKPNSKNPLANKPIERIVFHEITPSAIKEALKKPRAIDPRRVDAQQARRILDRLVGYKLSPFLWKKVYRGLSAGRVQSAALRLIVEREREIEEFVPKEYWTISAILIEKGNNDDKKELNKAQNADDLNNTISSKSNTAAEFEAKLLKINQKVLDKFALKSKADADKIIAELKDAEWMIENIEKKAVSKNPLPPFTTSTLQQDAFRRLGFSAKQTMIIAQQLYEGIELGEEGPTGLITYMRTDSLNVSAQAVASAREFINKSFGSNYLPTSARQFKTKTKGAQEAHEAIRPTDPWRTPEEVKPFLDSRQFKLYKLIWQRFIATQMASALFDSTVIDVLAKRQASNNKYTFRANGQILRFDGFLKLYPIKFSENFLPDLKPNQELNLKKLKPDQHFTQPPPRYTEASLVKMLEKYGIGRPSTYAPIIATIQERGYVQKQNRRYLAPTDTGKIVNDLLVQHFPKIVDIGFTAKMEEDLDKIAEGKAEWRPVLREFYEPFSKLLEQKYEEVKKQQLTRQTDQICEQCGKPMVIRLGRFGKFLACSGFPECKNTKTIREEPEKIDLVCPKCKKGDIIIRRTKRGRLFFGCSQYPECDYATWNDPRKQNTNNKQGSNQQPKTNHSRQ